MDIPACHLREIVGAPLDMFRNVFKVSIVSALILLQSYLLYPVLPIYIASRGITGSEYGSLKAFAVVSYMLTLVPLCTIADIYGRRKMLYVMLLLLALIRVSYIYASCYEHFLLISIARGVCSSAIMLILTAILMDVSPKKKRGQAKGLATMTMI